VHNCHVRGVEGLRPNWRCQQSGSEVSARSPTSTCLLRLSSHSRAIALYWYMSYRQLYYTHCWEVAFIPELQSRERRRLVALKLRLMRAADSPETLVVSCDYQSSLLEQNNSPLGQCVPQPPNIRVRCDFRNAPEGYVSLALHFKTPTRVGDVWGIGGCWHRQEQL